MMFNLCALAACLYILINGYRAFISGTRKEDKSFFWSIPIRGLFKTPEYVTNLTWGEIFS